MKAFFAACAVAIVVAVAAVYLLDVWQLSAGSAFSTSGVRL